jgi:hypothetical protein
MQDFDLAGVAVIAVLIIPIIQFAKHYFPLATGDTWRLVSFCLGLIAAFAKAVLQLGSPLGWDYGAWVGVVVAALLAALAAGKAYDELFGTQAQERKIARYNGRTL